MRQQFRSFAQQCLPALTALVVLTVLCGLVFPLAVTGVAQAAFRDRADGSLIERDGEVVVAPLGGLAGRAVEAREVGRTGERRDRAAQRNARRRAGAAQPAAARGLSVRGAVMDATSARGDKGRRGLHEGTRARGHEGT